MTRWTEAQLDAFYYAQRGLGRKPLADTKAPPFQLPGDKRLALGRLPTGAMNKTEAAYDKHLSELHISGAVLWHKFEGIKLRLADNTFYTPDFSVLAADLVLELHEVKGYWEDDARVKIKVAAAIFPFRFKAMKPRAKKNGGGWECEDF